jgi:2-polyprenyl-3-methyl-5-hydroxy-6-metoxy-1,4-benzoquinol methylase
MIKTWSTPVRAEQKTQIPCVSCGKSDFKSALDCLWVKCRQCGLVQMNPQPDKTDVLKRYSLTFSKDYLEYELANEKTFLQLQLFALQDSGFYQLEKQLFSDKNNPPRILDIGCATGALPAHLQDRGWQVTGIEISDSADYAKNTRKIKVLKVPVEEAGFAHNTFDVILASHLIEHLNNPRLFLGEVHRILKNNGAVFITTPNIDGFQSKLTGGKWRSAIFDHLYLFSKKTLSLLLRDTGFTIESIHTWGGLAAGLAPSFIKKPADFLAKHLGCGDVMIIRARKE